MIEQWYNEVKNYDFRSHSGPGTGKLLSYAASTQPNYCWINRYLSIIIYDTSYLTHAI